MDDSQIQTFLHRPKAYYNIDGLGELGMGFMAVAVTVLMWMQAHTGRNSVWHSMYLFAVYWAAMCATIHYGTKAIKTRITYRRTGFVEYRKGAAFWRLMAVVFAGSGLLVVGLASGVRAHWNLTMTGSIMGLILAACYGYGFSKTVPWKWAVFAVLTLESIVIAMLPPEVAAAVVDPAAPIPFPPAMAGTWLLSFALYGVTLLVSGGISFYIYLRRTQPQ